MRSGAGGPGWLNPLARPDSAATGSTGAGSGGEWEDRARSAGDEIAVEPVQVKVQSSRLQFYKIEVNLCFSCIVVNVMTITTIGGTFDCIAELQATDSDTASARGKLLLELYSGGTFKKSMNYHSFRGDNRVEAREVAVESLEDSLELPGSGLTVVAAPSETSRRSRLSDVFPDILNFRYLLISTSFLPHFYICGKLYYFPR